MHGDGTEEKQKIYSYIANIFFTQPPDMIKHFSRVSYYKEPNGSSWKWAVIEDNFITDFIQT
jgi:hypothetical protein